MDKIKVEGIRLYGFHGCLEEEGKIGTEYRANITVWGHLEKAAQTDQLPDTLDYVHINRIAEREVSQRSALIETVSNRIIDGILAEMPDVQKVKVKLAKLYPPINGDVASVSVVMNRSRY